jgi:hypothetical protein
MIRICLRIAGNRRLNFVLQDNRGDPYSGRRAQAAELAPKSDQPPRPTERRSGRFGEPERRPINLPAGSAYRRSRNVAWICNRAG